MYPGRIPVVYSGFIPPEGWDVSPNQGLDRRIPDSQHHYITLHEFVKSTSHGNPLDTHRTHIHAPTHILEPDGGKCFWFAGDTDPFI